MAYRSTALRILIACPGDVPVADLSSIHKAITRWNVLLGEQFESVIVPVSWSEHAASEFGEPPQDVLNRQLVDVADLGLAIFWNRLGTPTAEAESGTAEEIVRLHEEGKPVSVLRCNRPVSPNGDHAERARLDEYLQSIYDKALVMTYENDGELSRQVDTILTRLASQHEHSDIDVGSGRSRRRGASYVLPQIIEERSVEPGSKGQMRTTVRQRLTFENRGGAEAREIKWRLASADGDRQPPAVLTGTVEDNTGTIDVLAPDAKVEYPVAGAMGDATELIRMVDWQENGKDRHNETTLRT